MLLPVSLFCNVDFSQRFFPHLRSLHVPQERGLDNTGSWRAHLTTARRRVAPGVLLILKLMGSRVPLTTLVCTGTQLMRSFELSKMTVLPSETPVRVAVKLPPLTCALVRVGV